MSNPSTRRLRNITRIALNHTHTATALDANDPLRTYRDAFHIPPHGEGEKLRPISLRFAREALRINQKQDAHA